MPVTFPDELLIPDSDDSPFEGSEVPQEEESEE